MGRGHEGRDCLDGFSGLEGVVLDEQGFGRIGIAGHRQTAWQDKQLAALRQRNKIGCGRHGKLAIAHAGHVQGGVIYNCAAGICKDQ